MKKQYIINVPKKCTSDYTVGNPAVMYSFTSNFFFNCI